MFTDVFANATTMKLFKSYIKKHSNSKQPYLHDTSTSLTCVTQEPFDLIKQFSRENGAILLCVEWDMDFKGMLELYLVVGGQVIKTLVNDGTPYLEVFCYYLKEMLDEKEDSYVSLETAATWMTEPTVKKSKQFKIVPKDLHATTKKVNHMLGEYYKWNVNGNMKIASS